MKDPFSGNTINDHSKFPNILNNFFATVGNKLANQIPHTETHFTDFLQNIDQANSMFFTPVTTLEIEEEILSLSNGKAYGLYSCPIKLIKAAKHVLSEHLAKLMNLSVQTGKYPTKLKISKICPIFKSDDDTEPSNYRPISLLSVFNKIFEKTVYNRLINFIDKHDILSDVQYGFRKKHSTQHTLLDIINTIQYNMDHKLLTCAVFIDLAKAFDTVDHSILLKKLYIYGIRGCVYNWFKSYLSERTQTTSVNNCISDKVGINYGVPQGSILGPVLFLLYINDICNVSKILKFHIFADDTNILYSNKCIKKLESTMNTELEKLQIWFIANKLTINTKKTNFVIFHSSRRLIVPINIQIFDYKTNKFLPLDQKNYVKYLGVLLDSKLSWKPHIDYISGKISRMAGIFSRLRHFIPKRTLIKMYNSILQPILTYGIASWGQACKTLTNKLLILQKRVIRSIFFAKTIQSAIPLFIDTKILPVTSQYLFLIAQLMYDVENNKVPINIAKLFTRVKNIHSYNTRSSSRDDFYTKHSRLNIQRNSFSRLGVRLWNQIPTNIREMSKSSFKKEIRSALFNHLKCYGYDIDITKLFK